MELRSLFNQLDLVGRATELNYTTSRLSWRRGSPELESKFGVPFVSTVLRFVSPDESITFDVHAYLSFDKQILGASQLLDPKAIYLLRKVRFYAVSGSDQ
jgi:hypothetical protein